MDLTAISLRAAYLLNDPSEKRYTLAQKTAWANDALSVITDENEAIEATKTLSTIAYQQKYNQPSDCWKPMFAYWEDNPLAPMDWEQYVAVTGRNNLASNGDPTNIIYWNSEIYLYPIRSARSSQATLSGSHTASATRFIVVSTTGFPNAGRFIADSEVIDYTNKSATKFSGCTRGMENTTATSHDTAILLSERDITIQYYGKQASDLSAGADTPGIPAAYHNLIVIYVVWQGFLSSKNLDQADRFEKRFLTGLEKMKTNLLRRRYMTGYPRVRALEKYPHLGRE